MTEEQLLLKHERMGLDCFIAAAVVTGIVGVGSSIASGVSSSNAAGAQASAANHAADLQMQQYQQTRQDQLPYMNAGTVALSQIGQQQATGTGFAAPSTLPPIRGTPLLSAKVRTQSIQAQRLPAGY